MTDFVVRDAVPADAPALVALAQEVGAEPEGWLIADDSWRGVADERRYPHPASFHVADLGLMVAVGNRRRGVGRALLARAVEWAEAARVRKLELHVFPHNEPAIALYESFGFVREGFRREHYRRGTGYVDAILMAYWVGGVRED